MRLDGYVINPFLSLAVSHVIFTGRDKQVGLLMIALNNCEGPWAHRARQVKVRFPRVALELANDTVLRAHSSHDGVKEHAHYATFTDG